MIKANFYDLILIIYNILNFGHSFIN